MVSAKATVDINASADDVWELIGGFGSLPDWIPDMTQTKLAGGGRLRYLSDRNGQSIVEKLERYDASTRSYSYSIVKAPFPVAGYLATLSVTPLAGSTGCRVEWSASFTPVGSSDREAQAIFQNIFSASLKALEKRYSKNR
jgi:hypothetical protein